MAFTVDKVDNYDWQEKVHTGRRTRFIHQSYEVTWEGYTETSRVNHMDISRAAIREYWDRVNAYMDEYKAKIARGEQFEETDQGRRYREAVKRVEMLVAYKPDVQLPDQQGYNGEFEERILASCDKKIEECNKKSTLKGKGQSKARSSLH